MEVDDVLDGDDDDLTAQAKFRNPQTVTESQMEYSRSRAVSERISASSGNGRSARVGDADMGKGITDRPLTSFSSTFADPAKWSLEPTVFSLPVPELDKQLDLGTEESYVWPTRPWRIEDSGDGLRNSSHAIQCNNTPLHSSFSAADTFPKPSSPSMLLMASAGRKSLAGGLSGSGGRRTSEVLSAEAAADARTDDQRQDQQKAANRLDAVRPRLHAARRQQAKLNTSPQAALRQDFQDGERDGHGTAAPVDIRHEVDEDVTFCIRPAPDERDVTVNGRRAPKRPFLATIDVDAIARILLQCDLLHCP